MKAQQEIGQIRRRIGSHKRQSSVTCQIMSARQQQEVIGAGLFFEPCQELLDSLFFTLYSEFDYKKTIKDCFCFQRGHRVCNRSSRVFSTRKWTA